MGETLKIIDCKEDYKFQGPRYIRLGPESGEEFRDSYFIPWLKENKGKSNLKVDFEGTVVYTPSFLEETFGGAIRAGYPEVKDLEFINIKEEEKKRTLGYIAAAIEKLEKGGK